MTFTFIKIKAHEKPLNFLGTDATKLTLFPLSWLQNGNIGHFGPDFLPFNINSNFLFTAITFAPFFLV